MELFSGCGRLSSALADAGLRTAVPFELSQGSEFDLSRQAIQEMILRWIRRKRVWYVHLGTPCQPWSQAYTGPNRDRRRQAASCLVRFTCRVIEQCVKSGIRFSLENPASSALFKLPCVRRTLLRADALMVRYHCCRYGCSYKKPTILATNCSALSQLGLECQGCRGHEILQGRVKIREGDKVRWRWKTSLAGAYSPLLCQQWARVLLQCCPRHAVRSHGEPRLLEAWQLEARQVAGSSNTDRLFELNPCPARYECPWKHCEAEWGGRWSGRACQKEAATS